MAGQPKIVFNGFNALRAFGALAVFISHIEFLRREFLFTNHMDIPFYKSGGGDMGVILFFVLSGFLITYLLLAEKTTFQKISLGKFYVRRTLRIWPIYYLMLIIAFVILPFCFAHYPGRNFDAYGWKFLLCIFFAPNFSLAFLGGVPGMSHLWSIGVEEQFYLVWPVIIEKLNRWLVPVLLFIFIGVSLAPHVCDWLFSHHFNSAGYTQLHFACRSFLDGFKINSMALGALFALIYFKKVNFLLKIIYHKAVEIPVFILAFAGWASGFSPFYFKAELYSLLFAIIILNVGTNPNPFFSLRNRLLDFYGKISYGFYVYHWAIILVTYIFIRHFDMDKSITGWGFDIVAYTLPFVLTTLVSAFSYFYFEKAILQYKNRFERVASGSV